MAPRGIVDLANIDSQNIKNEFEEAFYFYINNDYSKERKQSYDLFNSDSLILDANLEVLNFIGDNESGQLRENCTDNRMCSLPLKIYGSAPIDS